MVQTTLSHQHPSLSNLLGRLGIVICFVFTPFVLNMASNDLLIPRNTEQEYPSSIFHLTMLMLIMR